MTLRHVVALLALLYWLSAGSGCIMDPLGVCSTGTRDEGCGIDPLGGCRG